MHSDLPLPDPLAQAHSDTLAAHLRAEIGASGGAIPFSRFMELCLYAPGLGYYSAGSTKFGAAGDFVTAPEQGRLFAATVAGVLAMALRSLGPGARVLELGGGSGAFAGQAAFAIAMDPATGVVTVEQYLSLDHPIGTDPDDTLQLIAGSILVGVTVKDSDGDTRSSNVIDSGVAARAAPYAKVHKTIGRFEDGIPEK